MTEVSEHFGRAEAEVVKVRVKEWELLATVGFDWAEQRWFTKSLTRETELGSASGRSPELVSAAVAAVELSRRPAMPSN